MSYTNKTFFRYFFIILIFSLLLFAAPLSAEEKIDYKDIRGPKIDTLALIIISNSDSQVMSAEAGEIDIVGDITRASDIDRLSLNKKLSMSLARGLHAFFLLLNDQTPPWDDKDVRRAAAMSIDRNSIVRMLFSGYCEPINSWLPPVSPWALANSSEDIFSPEAAKTLLKEKGYSWDISGRLLDPSGKPLPPLRLFSTVARVAPTSAALAELIADSLNAVGFPVEVEPMDFSAMMARLDRKDYSLAVLAWSMGKNPDYLYSFYHSEMDVDGGYNLTGTHDKALDEALSALRFAPDKTAAEAASTKAQRLLLDLMPSIPIYSRISVAAVSNKWKGIFTTDRVTADNFWTLLNAEPKDGKMRPLRMALADEPRNLNPFTASSAYAWQVLGLIYESMISNDPNTLENIPAIAESWQVTVNEDGADRHTELFFKIKHGLKWNDGSPLDARDIKASIDFIHKNKIPRYFDAVKDIRSVETPDNFTLRVNMDGVSYWYLDNVGGLPILPRKVIAKVKDWQTWNPLNPEGGDPRGLIGSGPFMYEKYQPGEYVIMKRNPHYRLLKGGAE